VNYLATRLGGDLSAGVCFYGSAPDPEDRARRSRPADRATRRSRTSVSTPAGRSSSGRSRRRTSSTSASCIPARSTASTTTRHRGTTRTRPSSRGAGRSRSSRTTCASPGAGERGRQVADQARRRIVAVLVGVLLALAVGLLATAVGLDRDRAFYPTRDDCHRVLVCAVRQVMGASMHALVLESLVGAVFIAAAVCGFRSSLWVVALALAAHGVFDLAHGRVISNPGVPAWWPGFCLTYDVTAAAIFWRGCSRAIASGLQSD